MQNKKADLKSTVCENNLNIGTLSRNNFKDSSCSKLVRYISPQDNSLLDKDVVLESTVSSKKRKLDSNIDTFNEKKRRLDSIVSNLLESKKRKLEAVCNFNKKKRRLDNIVNNLLESKKRKLDQLETVSNSKKSKVDRIVTVSNFTKIKLDIYFNQNSILRRLLENKENRLVDKEKKYDLDSKVEIACSYNDNKVLKALLEAGPFERFKKFDSVKLKDDVKEHLLCKTVDQIKDKIFSTFIHLTNSSKKDSVVNSTNASRLKASREAFNAVFNDYTIENFHKYFKCKVRYGYVHSDNTIELLKCSNDIITDNYAALVLFKDYRVYIIKKHYKKYINFGSFKGNFCVKCGLVFTSAMKHLQFCPILGTKLSVGCKVGGDSLAITSQIKNALESLGIEEEKDSIEPEIFIRRNVSLESAAVVHLKTDDQIYRTLFNLYFYNSNNSKINLKMSNMSKKCTSVYKDFIKRYKTVSLEHLELYFKDIRLKFYIKCQSTNQLLPCTYKTNNDNVNAKLRKTCIIYVIGNYIISPRSHNLKWVKIKNERSAGFCFLCNRYYSNLYRHSKMCTTNCSRCLTVCNTLRFLSTYVSCLNCRISFKSIKCYENHLHKTCKKIFCCQYCNQYVNKFINNAKHSCTSTKCGICYAEIDKNDFLHQCKINPSKKRKKLPNAIQIFYDFEAYIDNDNYQAFQPCLAVAQTACNQCTIFKKENADSICENCRSINKTFLGTN